jgi:hypothetical protein
MNTLITICLLLLTAIAFYRWVERRHKIVLAKALAALAILVAAGFALIFYQERQADAAHARLQRSVAILFIRPNVDTISDPVVQYLASIKEDTLSSVTFRLCNRGSDTVSSVRFWPKTSRIGRSTEYDLVILETWPRQTTNEFFSDVILAPGGCTELTWSDRWFRIMNMVNAGSVSVEKR